VSIVVAAIAIALVQPALVLTLELVVEDDSTNAPATRRQALCFAFVRAIDLDVVFELPLAFNAMPERLMTSLIAVAVTLEQASSFSGQRDRIVAAAGHANRLDEPLLAEVPEIAGSWINWTIVVIPQITTGDHPKRADGRERARLPAAQRVLVTAVAHDLSLNATRQVQISCEWLTRIEGTIWRLTIAICPARIVIPMASMVLGMREPRVSWPATECPRITVAIAGSVWSPRVVNRVQRIRVVATAAIVNKAEAFVVARIVIARIEVKHGALRAGEIADVPAGARTAAV
jgi:hypothetical protein